MHSPSSDTEARLAERLFRLLIGVFFAGGLLTAMSNLMMPRVEITMGLSHAQASTVQIAFYSGYLLFGVPATMLLCRIGYMRMIAAGLGIMALACGGLGAAGSFAVLLASLLMLSTGITFLQIAANAVMSAVGSERYVESRFTLLQAFNSLGTVSGPLLAAWFLLGKGGLRPGIPYAVMAVVLAALAIAFTRARAMLPARAEPDKAPVRRLPSLLKRPRMLGGVIAIFAYVGAEVTVGTLGVDYLRSPARLGIDAASAGRLISLYWAGAMLGRFVGSFWVRRVGAAHLLARACWLALILVMAAAMLHGPAGAVALIALGLANSVMFPLGYALALPETREDIPVAAMLLCLAVSGGAVIPFVAGMVADRAGLSAALLVPGVCYVAILAFALRRSTSATVDGGRAAGKMA